MSPILGATIAIIAVSGILLAITPWLMPKTEFFTVVVPSEHADDPQLLGYRRRYTIVVGIIVVLCLFAWIPIVIADPSALSSQQSMVRVTALIVASVLIPLAVGFALMLRFRSKVSELKRAQGWSVESGRGVALLGLEDIPKPPSTAIYLVYIPLVIGFATIPFAFYDLFPQQIPMHAGFDGTVNSYVDKSVAVLLFPALLTAFMGAAFAFTHWTIARSKRPLDPAAPTATAYAYGAFARAECIALFAGGLALNVSMGVAFMLSSSGVISLGTAGLVVLIMAVVLAVAMVGVAIAYGQNGSRILRDMQVASPVSAEDESHWVLGVFYVNRDDASTFVPKRFGIGWTINLARPTAWLAIAGLAVAIVVFTLAMVAIVS